MKHLLENSLNTVDPKWIRGKVEEKQAEIERLENSIKMRQANIDTLKRQIKELLK